MNRTYKLIFVGESGVGKTTFIKRHLTGDFEKSWLATVGTEVHPLKFETNQGDITFNCWDTAGKPMFMCSGVESYGINADAAIVMFDHIRIEGAITWINRINASFNIPIVVVMTKTDITDHPRFAGQASGTSSASGMTREFLRTLKGKSNVVGVTEISSKTCYNFDKPFNMVRKAL